MKKDTAYSRRDFLKSGGLLLAGTTCGGLNAQETGANNSKVKIKEYRKLGRTGFKVSDISIGGTRNRESAVFRYAYDHGINYFDTAEGYINGNSEKLLGQALKHMDRKKIFITTKLHIDDDESKDDILQRFDKCQERMQTDYVDALYMHNVPSKEMLDYQPFHQVVKELKQAGRLRFAGVSCHGPRRRGRGGESMEEVLCAAAADGRFDLMLLIYNFMNSEAGEKILKVCKENNVGTTAMKTRPGVLKAEPFDPQNPSPSQKAYLDRLKERGRSDDEALERLKDRLNRDIDLVEKTKPFVTKYGLKTEDELIKASIRWVLDDQDMQSVVISFSNFDQIDKYVPVSGSKLSGHQTGMLQYYGKLFSDEYCRHGCNACAGECPEAISVSTVMRYAYYYQCQGREKEAMQKYKNLHSGDISCLECSAPCIKSCPFDLNIPKHMIEAHGLLC